MALLLSYLPVSYEQPTSSLLSATGKPAAFHSGSPSSSLRALKPELAELGDGLERQHAVGAAAVGDDLGLAVELGQLRA